MKTQRIPKITKQLLFAGLVLALIPSLVVAGEMLSVDEQLVQAAGRGDLAEVSGFPSQIG